MKLKMFSIYDSKVAAFNAPVFLRSTGEALRSFSDAVNKQGDLKSHAEDYTFFELGLWDDQNARFELYDTPRSLGLALEFLKEGV